MQTEWLAGNHSARHLQLKPAPSLLPAEGHKFLTPEKAAAYLGGLNSRTVTRWAREGYLPAYPIGEGKRRLWRFLECDLDKWMRARRTGGISLAVQMGGDTLLSAADASPKGA